MPSPSEHAASGPPGRDSGLDAERRPIATRDAAWAKTAASWLGRAGASPNGISVVGMMAGVAAGAAFWGTSAAGSPWVVRGLWLAGAACVQLRLMCNMFDGMVAIETGQRSVVGEFYNEAPDRVSDAGTLIGAGLAVGGDLRLGLAAALTAVFVAYVRAMAKAAGAPNDFCGPMAKPHRMALVTVAAVWCAATPAAWRAIPLAGHDVTVMDAALLVIVIGGLFTAWRRLARAAKALRAKSA